ncbi:LytTR family DNA-binding domain-containing protein [Parabacteroides distasonis]|nr:LytTR family DNA-binding domain-containing protein [Parabacteroides distasonis]MDB9153127.1 LytTR family DNA-binding domain-containing protein [Parabacteroides distasonis]MDB9157698.1 LytTR family DNA-binding domain-containing protein [Parabacteroides distasonis]MDB9166563.1 LytTR family DNA-binding domain-containing protein [Parabacteroides distasonis]MDB9170982.1 LytTR family DNA-binding domain-containing protein [Parabacteroides distasonis]MDB9195874.1 LytTR family DNA-binding domain-con
MRHIQTVSSKEVVYTTLKQLYESLPQDIFLQIHRSYISNINQVNAHPIFIEDRVNSKG